jgi:hypothetical protein
MPSGSQSGNHEPPSKEAFMFLHKRGSIWYIWYDDPQTGNRKKISSGCEKKSAALSFFRTFVPPSTSKIPPTAPLLSVFASELEQYQRPLLRPGTVDVYKRSFTVFKRIIGDMPIEKISRSLRLCSLIK